MLLSLLVASTVALVAPDASAVWINGQWFSKGVQCTGEATVKNVDKNMVTITCSVDLTPPMNNEPNVILVCRNPGGNISIGNAFVNEAIFDVALIVPNPNDIKKGKTTFQAVLGGGGIAPNDPACVEEDGSFDIYCNCDHDDFCQTLREACPNPNWVPIDVVPLAMTATVATYFCNNDQDNNGDPIHSCPCDPTITDPQNAFACASATGSNNDPWTYNWQGGPVPWAREVSECTLPDPGTFQFGEQREYDCTVIIDESQ
jgi:hypothetical protein